MIFVVIFMSAIISVSIQSDESVIHSIRPILLDSIINTKHRVFSPKSRQPLTALDAIVRQPNHEYDSVFFPNTTLTTTTAVDNLWCTDSSALSSILRYRAYEESIPCTGIVFDYSPQTFNITFRQCLNRNNPKCLKLLTINPQTYQLFLEGFLLVISYAQITDPLCADTFYLLVQLYAPSGGSTCGTPFGLTGKQSVWYWIDIYGGPCRSQCYGHSFLYHNPGVQYNYV
ncbi:unnamed protein product [Medioppia subpectinata]|uniref:Uncharacterized protein n=1 Tax=Medioppia subpectinata TaxID=1979941 RepID=A0A7R9PXG0_9ACAR|nr:unnamed protein product [Medioppia subpectinata]CAG2103961.1 unnamed protein product [Medioppia subpectinata]